MRIFLASSNPGKLREFWQAAQSAGIDVDLVPGITDLPVCVEDGLKFEDNAHKKAVHYSSLAEGLIFADDSGICVDALCCEPGVHSARYAGPEADDAANNEKLITTLAAVEASRAERGCPRLYRGAHYVCVIALAKQGNVLMVTKGRADGLIIDSPRGTNGFGYDPYFLYTALGKTFAELAPEQKLAISHRGKAFRELLRYLGKR
jgi:XTP/dITP diphosphohydrolase